VSARTRSGVAALALAAACAGEALLPRDIVPGVDACEGCHMLVDDPQRAAEWVGDDGTILTFDEPGCLVAWLVQHPDEAGRPWVADFAGGVWVRAEEAHYLRDGLRTGMGYDVLAFADARAAEATAAGVDARDEADRPSPRVQTWAELLGEGVRVGGSDGHGH